MKSTDTMLRLTGSLILLLLLYAFAPWVGENTSSDLARLTPVLAVLSTPKVQDLLEQQPQGA